MLWLDALRLGAALERADVGVLAAGRNANQPDGVEEPLLLAPFACGRLGNAGVAAFDAVDVRTADHECPCPAADRELCAVELFSFNTLDAPMP